jgi:regulator of protease activity HflC (stomatin/prohibitin superfamily)
MGKYSRTLKAGIHYVFPIVQRVSKKISILERVKDFPKSSVYTGDNVEIQISASVFYRITNAEKSVYRIENLDEAIYTTILGKLRGIIGSMSTDDILSKRSEINDKIKEQVNIESEDWGIEIKRTEILEIEFDSSIEESMKKQLMAEREKRETIKLAEGKAQSMKDIAVAKLFEKQKEAEEIKVIADAQAYQINIVSKSIKENGQEAANYELIKSQIKAFEKIGTSQADKLIIVPTDMTSSVGSLAVLTETISNSLNKGS